MVRSGDASVLLPYFYRYLEHGEFPDGKGMINQPVALVNALTTFVSYFRRFETADFDQRMKNSANKG